MRFIRSSTAIAALGTIAAGTLSFLQPSPAHAILENYRFQVTVSAPAELTEDLRSNGFTVQGTVKTYEYVVTPPQTVPYPPDEPQVPTTQSPIPRLSSTPVPSPLNQTRRVQAPVPQADVSVRVGSVTQTGKTDASGVFKIGFTPSNAQALGASGLVLVEASVFDNLTVTHPGVKVTPPAVSTNPPSVNPTPTGPTVQVVPPVNETLAGRSSSLMRIPTPVNGLVSQMSAGGFHTCVLLADTTVRCFGANGSGQLGDGTKTQRSTPTPVPGLNKVAKVAAGGEHTCVLHTADEDGTQVPGQVSCWGNNADGQLGSSGASTEAPRRVAFSPEDKALGAVDISAGYSHTCALMADASLRCWGSNILGQLGVTGPSQTDVPQKVDGLVKDTKLRGAVEIAAGLFHTCARVSTPSAAGQIACWGYNDSGQLGTGDRDASAQPKLVQQSGSAVQGASSLTAGLLHTCARLSNQLACWGNNAYGQLGDGSNTDRLSAQVNSPLTAVTNTAAGGFHSCIVEQLIAACSGSNDSGQLGDDTTTDQNFFTPVKGLSVLQPEVISGGLRHTCLLTTTRSVMCWGNNEFGQLGDGTAVAKKRATQVVGLESVTSIFAGATHSCAVTSANNVRCWGDNSSGQIGDGTTADKLAPTVVTGLKATSVAVGAKHSCAIGTDSTVRCWGDNADGQLGDGTTTQKTSPNAISGTTAKAITAGVGYTCAIVDGGSAGTADDTARCWGRNADGQLGDNSTTSRMSPVSVSNSSTIVAIGAGRASTCGLFDQNTSDTSDDIVKCWGDNSKGQLGDFTTTDRLTPVPVTGTRGAIGLAVGADHACALLSSSSMRCWGANESGQLGDGTTTQRRQATPVSGLNQVRKVVAGGSTTCVIGSAGTGDLGDDTMFCWGSNDSGQFGEGPAAPSQRTSPFGTGPGIKGIRVASSGTSHTCAVSVDGTARCWGANAKGQLGDGTTNPSDVPVNVPFS
ncbi:MAG: RCC1 repeat-containing protein [Actinomycetota bacterium]